MSRVEIAPGIFFKKDRGRFRVCIQADEQEIIAWDYEEICGSPEAWFSSLKAVSLATQRGPSVAKAWVERRRVQNGVTPGTLICNICQQKFVVEINSPFVFIAELNGRKYHDYQCSEECNKKRYQQVYSSEMGNDFMQLWTQVKTSSLENLEK